MAGHSRRAVVAGTAVLGATALLAGCSGGEGPPAAQTLAGDATDLSAAPGRRVVIGFSAPAADHGWLAAITNNARRQARALPDVEFKMVAAGANAAAQRAALSTLIAERPDVIVVLPYDGKELNGFGVEAMRAGVPVVNLDRAFPNPAAFRLQLKGDNYGMGVAAARYIISRLRARKVERPVIGEIAGLDFLELTQERSRGFKDTLAEAGWSVANRRAAAFTVDSGQREAAHLLQALPHVHALWNHDDDQGVGVLAAVEAAKRGEFFMVGGAGSRQAMQTIKAGGTVLEATVTYSPSMASSAILLARLIAQERGLSDLAELAVPREIVLASETITRDNADAYLHFGF
ncbi:substrate-binding domain-containing protein [Catellatospora vulcania]|uniref:substrate-binding domain-containing protein n=1 Tax=Catellatospora vulcania TaxID=1460450 RepID=UPI0012D3B009|nr:substrate-binding domain-containing protein [Catellatospora vulcania]